MEHYKKLITAWGLLSLLSFYGADAVNSLAATTGNLAENSAAVSTQLAGASGTAPYTFVVTAQTASLDWFVVSSSGVISLASGMTVNFEEASLAASSTYVITLTVTDSAGTPVVTPALTFTYTITNVNEAPVFGSDAYAAKFTASQAAGSAIITTAATDLESDTITYSIDDDTNFAISAAGAVTVNTGVTLASTTKYTKVYAADNATPALTATTHLFVCIGTTCACNAAAAITRSVVTTIGVLVTLLVKFT